MQLGSDSAVFAHTHFRNGSISSQSSSSQSSSRLTNRHAEGWGLDEVPPTGLPRPAPILAEAGIREIRGAEFVEEDGGHQGSVPNGRGAESCHSLEEGQVSRLEGHLGRMLLISCSGQMGN